MEWLQTNSRRALLIGSGALGLNLLTRLTTGLDLIAAGAFLVRALWFLSQLRSNHRRIMAAAPVFYGGV